MRSADQMELTRLIEDHLFDESKDGTEVGCSCGWKVRKYATTQTMYSEHLARVLQPFIKRECVLFWQERERND